MHAKGRTSGSKPYVLRTASVTVTANNCTSRECRRRSISVCQASTGLVIVYASPDELTTWVGSERGKSEPVHIASQNEDLVADLKRGRKS